LGNRITMGFVGPQNNDVKNAIALSALNKLLSANVTGRISQALKPYNTNVTMYPEKIGSRNTDPTALVVEAVTNEANCQKVLQEIFNQIHSVTVNPPSDEELAIIKKSMLNSYANNFESSFALNSLIGDMILDNNLEEVSNYEKIVKSLTKEDLVNVANQFLDLNKTAITVLHPDRQKLHDVNFTGKITKQAIDPKNVNRYVLANNLDLVTCNSKTDLCNVGLTFQTPEINNINPATAPILNAMIQEGTSHKSDLELEKYLTKNGIDLNLSADANGLIIFASSSADDLQKVYSTILEILSNPNFTEENFEFAKKKLVDRLKRQEKNVNSKLNKELLPKISAGNTK
ncbi:insulinase family protein, partial [bacterium]|nr:insulinase family protein [bacterium]